MKTVILITGLVLSLGLSTACAKTDPEPEASAADKPEAAAAVASTAAAPAATLPKEQEQSESSEGMRIPVDGDSLESFDQSLEIIKAKATEDEYTSLTGAIDYLMVYDIGARRDRAKLAQRLDGLTGEEILGRVNWGNKSENAGKKKRKKTVQEDQ